MRSTMGERIVRILLWRYPPAFRRRYADDIVAEVRARHDGARRAGSAGSRFWPRAAGDLVSTSIRVWGSDAYGRRGARRNVADGVSRAQPGGISSDEGCGGTRNGGGHEGTDDTRRRVAGAPPGLPNRQGGFPAPRGAMFLGVGLVTDVRQAFRGLRRRPGFALLAAATLGIGIGLTTSMFSIFDAFMLRGLPVPEPDRVVAVRRANPRFGPDSRAPASIDYYLDLRDANTSFEDLAAWSIAGNVTLAGEAGVPDQVTAFRITSNGFDVLRVEPVIGRGFHAADAVPGAQPVALLGYALWRGRFAADPGVVGSTVRVEGVPTTVIGVMQEGFEFPWNGELWLPRTIDPAAGRGQPGGQPWTFGRLRPGVSVAAAQAEIRAVVARLAEEDPETHGGVLIVVDEWLTDFWGRGMRQAGWAAMATVGLVLLLACLNVSNLLLGRAIVARRELAVRAALGAGRARLVRQMLFDAFAVATLGTVMGIGIAVLAMRAFDTAMDAMPFGRPWYVDAAIHPRVLLFSLTALTGAALVSGVVPALRVSRSRPGSVLKSEAAASSLRIGRTGRFLVITQVALASALLLVGGLFGRAIASARGFGLELQPGNLFMADVALPEDRYPDDGARARFWSELLTALRADPNVAAAAGRAENGELGVIALATGLPLVAMGTTDFRVTGEEPAEGMPVARFAAVTPDYFEVTRTALLRGRGFLDADDDDAAPVALVSESLARRHFDGGEAVGHHLLLPVAARGDGQQGADRTGGSGAGDSEGGAEPAGAGGLEVTIVGVLAEVHADAPNGEGRAPLDAIFVPLAQRPPRSAHVLIRTATEPLAVTPYVRARVAALDADLAVTRADSVQGAMIDESYFITVIGSLFMVFGVAALLLAAVGLYGVMAFSVQQRRREVGIRVALGASPAAVARLIARQGLMRVTLGLAAGLAAGVGLARLAPSLPYGVSATDPVVVGSIIAALVLSGVLAAWLPARRTARLDPLDAMRVD